MDSNYTPTNVQELINKPAFQQYIDAADLNISADDIIVMTSDGVTDVLPSRRITKTVEVKEIKKYTDSLNNTTTSESPSTNKFEHEVKEIDVNFLNQMLRQIYENLHSAYPNQQPPAFVIAKELVRLTFEFTIATKDANVNLASKLKDPINAYQEKVIAKNRKDYEELLKKNRLSYINLKDRINTHMPIVNNFLTSLFTYEENEGVLILGADDNLLQLANFNNEHKAVLKKNVLQNLTQKLTAKLLLESNSSGKSKEPAQEGVKLNIAQIKDIIKEVIQNLFDPSSPQPNDHIQIISNIFLKEIYALAEKFSGKSPSEKLIHDSVAEFLVSISHHQPRKISLFIQLMSLNQQKYEEYMFKWANQEKGFTYGLPEIIIKFFKEEIYPQKSEAQVKQEIAQLLQYVSCIDFEREDERARIPLPPKHTIKDFQTWLAKENASLSTELNQFINEHKINDKAQFEYLVKDLDISRMKFGDDTSVAVAYVPDPAVELVRAMIEYPNKREQLWTELNRLRPTNELLENIYKRLLNEKHVDIAEQTNLRHERQTVGQNAEVLSNKIVSSYSEDEILDIKQFLLTKIKLKTELSAIIDVKQLQGKTNAQRTLNQLLINSELSVLERCALYNQLKAEQFAKLNEHRHSGIDSFFGINITRSWSLSLKAIRGDSLQKLHAEIMQLQTFHKYEEALALLNKSLEEPLFNTHRNNSKITGAFGDTAAVKEIRRMIVFITSQRDSHEARNRLRT